MTKLKRKRDKLFDPPTPKMNFNRILGQGLKFRSSDLAENRQGHLSDRQIQMLLKTLRQDTWRTILVQSLIGLFIFWRIPGQHIYLAIDIIRSSNPLIPVQNSELFWIAGNLLIAFAVTLAMALFVYYQYRNTQKYRAEIKQGILSYAVGSVIINTHKRTRITVDGQNYKVKVDGHLSFRHLDPYLIYYLPKSKVVISAEPLN